ncbi:cholinesterase [Caerostris extrusa]|uniref:Cholinesterase n=1 Tax=Caerostris extrusa TaxID=172846 RepID=A0AAV4QR43_CAEEX|nr:cholinesterase [Caerostris extrusa]
MFEHYREHSSRKKNLGVFFYFEFAHRPSFSKHPDFLTAAHGDDVLFALALPLQLKDLPEDEAKLSKRIAQAFTTFSRNGNPNTEDSHPVWPRYTSEKQELMLFKTFRDNKGEPIQKSCYGKTSEFWNVIIPAAKNQDCPPSFAGLVNEENLSNSSFLGSDLYLPSSKLMVVGLIGISGLLLLIVIITVGALMKSRANPTFSSSTNHGAVH